MRRHHRPRTTASPWLVSGRASAAPSIGLQHCCLGHCLSELGDRFRDDIVASKERLMWDEVQFGISLAVSGLSIGLMYSLIALGFVLVYKATDAINFAQGEFVMLAGFVAAVALSVKGMPVIGAVLAAVAVMVLFSFALERIVLRPLLGRPVVAVIMATIGLGAILRGLPPITVGGRDARAVAADRRHADHLRADLAAADPGAGRRRHLAVPRPVHLVLPQEPHGHRHARGGRQPAGGDGHGHQRRALLRAGLGDGRHRLGAGRRHLGQHAGRRRATGAGRAQGVPGRDPRRPRLRSSAPWSAASSSALVESLAAGYLDPYVGGGTKDFAPYVLMIIALMFKPYGIFGTHRIERV